MRGGNQQPARNFLLPYCSDDFGFRSMSSSSASEKLVSSKSREMFLNIVAEATTHVQMPMNAQPPSTSVGTR